ncbi:30S ribosomal protein S1 [Candidatus Parcubacteria bacterium A4]|nr:MAG: 30S ribosomal protein S1 [Candidatus Parcubacteria bacterium A4]
METTIDNLIEEETIAVKEKKSVTQDGVKPLRVGDIVEGEVIGRGRSSIFLDLDPIGTGIIYGKEFYDAREELKALEKGDKVFAKVTDLENEKGYIELSMSDASKELAWDKLKEKKDGSELITVKITGANKGGLMGKVAGVAAFLPVSQLEASHYPRVEDGDSSKILKELQKFIGQELEVKIFDLSQKENKLILSEKVKGEEKIKEILGRYKVGDVVDGEITAVTDFGAFMKFGEDGLEGLIHISELDWQLIENPTEIVKTGEKVTAKIIEISNSRVSLSLKALKKDPWIEIEKEHKRGEKLKGTIVKINPFGAFVQITPEIRGLCHISEFGAREKMTESLKEGNQYNFEILEIKPAEHRISLRLAE